MVASPKLPLADLRVIDCATLIAGPGCARYLGDFGADVIKVERPDGGDGTRNLGWRDPADGVTLWWKHMARNKRCVTLNLRERDGQELFHRLQGIKDTFTTNTHYSLLQLDVVEAVVMAVVNEDSALGADARRWLDDDEFIVRRRIHRDFHALKGQAH